MKAITHRDQIHGDVRFDSLAIALLNTQPLQRLGRIYQLGYAHLVFRGGTHTRLSHVMGASHAASQLVDFLRQNYQEGELPLGAIEPEEFLPKGNKDGTLDDRWDVLRHLVRWAALLHDIGHVPLGHTLEDEFEGIYVKHDDFRSKRIPYLWYEVSPGGNASEVRQVFERSELLPESFEALGISGERAWQTVMLICLHKEGGKNGSRQSFRQIVEASDENEIRFIKILKAALADAEGKTYLTYMADIVGNTICADYLDYLRRDAINVGLDVLRDNRVASRFFIARDAQSLYRMALALEDRHGKPRLDTCTGVVELVRQRFRFAEIIYYHKTKVAASAMLAKVFALIGNPQEVGPPARLIEVDDVPNLTARMIGGELDAGTLRQQCFPSALLDPTIGDETLLLWLQVIGFERLTDAKQAGDAEKVSRCLRGLSLLQSVVRRKLYKVCLTIDKNIYREMTPGSKEEPEIERRIEQTLANLRNNQQKRSDLETKMATAAGWPVDSLLLYVPPRKSQAKGIETKALDRGDVVTLGTHSAVREEVSRLSESYKKLWRIIVLVHPKFRRDALGLSKAADMLLLDIWPSIDLRAAAKAIEDATLFHYIPENQRLAAREYKRLAGERRLDWKCFDEAAYRTVEGTVSTEEHAQRAMLLALVSAKGGSPAAIKNQFGRPNSLAARLKEIESALTVEGREAATDVELAAIEKIANELVLGRSEARRGRKKRDPQLPL